MADEAAETTRCGIVAVVGRPNVGKSTLVNALVGQKISIVTHKPQTTRHRIMGIKSTASYQLVLVDTPGFHIEQKQAINRHMNRAALNALRDVDLVIFVTQPGRWGDEEERLLARLPAGGVPVLAAINKADLCRDKTRLLPELQALSARHPFEALVPVSARTGDGVDALEHEAAGRLPPGPFLFDAEQVSDKSLRFIAAELIREQLYIALQEELPYSVTVEIEAFEEEAHLIRIGAVIWVAKAGHKAIVIGRGGRVLKKVGKSARKAMEAAFETRVFVELWTKVKEGWNDDERALQSLGYQTDE